MRIVYEYSHLGGMEIMAVRYPVILQEIREIISKVTPLNNKKSGEKTIKGDMLYDPKDLNSQFNTYFRNSGFKDIKEKYTVTIPGSDISISGAYKQVNFLKEKVLVEVQFGNYAFLLYDMAKFQFFFNENKADVGIEIVPCHGLHHQMSSGVSYGEQLNNDIERLKKHFPAVSVAVLLIDTDE